MNPASSLSDIDVANYYLQHKLPFYDPFDEKERYIHNSHELYRDAFYARMHLKTQESNELLNLVNNMYNFLNNKSTLPIFNIHHVIYFPYNCEKYDLYDDSTLLEKKKEFIFKSIMVCKIIFSLQKLSIADQEIVIRTIFREPTKLITMRRNNMYINDEDKRPK
jgi:hypothetical protein